MAVLQSRMLTYMAVLHFMYPGDWFTPVNLKDVYFHIPVYAYLSAQWAEALLMCLALFRWGKDLPFRTCLRLLGPLASAIVVILLGRLIVRGFLKWLASLDVVRSHHLHCYVRV